MEDALIPHPTTAAAVTTTTTDAADTAPSAPTILTRLAAVLILALLSLWANHEASKGFEITILNSAAASRAGRRFDLMFVSNGRAARIVHGASQFVERALFPDALYPRKPVGRVTLQLASHNLTAAAAVSVGPGAGRGDYVISVSPSIMSGPGVGTAVSTAVHRGMARVWLWDGQGAAPPALLDAMADYLAASAGFPLTPAGLTGGAALDGPCWAAGRGGGGGFIGYCEERRRGFVVRLNRGMRGRWSERAVGDALGSPARWVCAGYRSSAREAGGAAGRTLGHASWR